MGKLGCAKVLEEIVIAKFCVDMCNLWGSKLIYFLIVVKEIMVVLFLNVYF